MSTWLDVEMQNQSVAAMEEGVRGCKVFVLCLSEKYFESEFCCKELRWANEAGKPIVLVHAEGLNVGAVLRSMPQEFKGSPAFDETSVQIVMSNPRLRQTSMELIV